MRPAKNIHIYDKKTYNCNRWLNYNIFIIYSPNNNQYPERAIVLHDFRDPLRQMSNNYTSWRLTGSPPPWLVTLIGPTCPGVYTTPTSAAPPPHSILKKAG